ncbi:LacI family transcriptional regulator [Spinactinospora alkalitolerans]|uniref:LacI family transcriptional regulator n=1 Tax=Spinactinospora alkalitolerans TaxID=687207 RepID=A0A852TPZ5_9ACTN|nr:LacI family DNA-binding transcriptional regulator [Spinactinospora alkalitolerans]NYE46059.1 LacI family transcriptional regulator [Spinactinospora alkalitolerans]
MHRITIAQVAAKAGVSTATVSRALSGARPVSDEIRRRVDAAARELGYSGNTIASALRRSRTDTVGMVVPSIANPFFTSLVESVEHVLQAEGRQLFLCDSRQDTSVEEGHLRSLAARQVDGIIISPCHGTRSTPAVEAAAAAIPLVQLDRHVAGTNTDWVGVDDHESMRLLLEHLHGTGARSAAFISSTLTNSSTELRLAGFRLQTQRLAMRTRPDWILLGEYSVDWGRRATAVLLGDADLPEAIVCADDLIALGALRACRDHGVDVPGDIRITGYDDIDFAALFEPALTTISQPRDRIAAEAVRLLATAAQGGAAAAHIALAPSLVVRQSTGAGGQTGPQPMSSRSEPGEHQESSSRP